MKYPVVLVLLIFPIFMLWLCVSSCNGRRTPASTNSQDSLPGQDSGTVKNQFFPVDDYLEAEILNVDSMPMAFWKYVTHDNRTDSALITAGDFNALALQFLPPEIRDGGLNKNFTESSFADRATQSITFTYTPIDKTLPLQRVDVQTVAGVRAQEVRSIYMERSHTAGDSVILQKLLWRAKHGFTIVSRIQVKGQAPKDQQVRVSWAGDEDEQ
ncbi:MAG TPA: hypothetical protein VGS79_11990 [Puia sp.]|nr:hypothetical protein [Puia sp.]